MKRLDLLLAFSFFLTVPAWGQLSKTYPTSPVTVLRIEAFTDSFGNIYNSSYTVTMSTWGIAGNSYVYMDSSQTVSGWTEDTSTSPFIVYRASWTLQQYTDMVTSQARQEAINEVLDKDVEQFMVWPGTDAPQGWRGWCSQKIGSSIIAIPCP